MARFCRVRIQCHRPGYRRKACRAWVLAVVAHPMHAASGALLVGAGLIKSPAARDLHSGNWLSASRHQFCYSHLAFDTDPGDPPRAGVSTDAHQELPGGVVFHRAGHACKWNRRFVGAMRRLPQRFSS